MENSTMFATIAVALTIIAIVSAFGMATESQEKYQAQQELQEFTQEAFERGHMVQCLGRTGFYWECD